MNKNQFGQIMESFSKPVGIEAIGLKPEKESDGKFQSGGLLPLRHQEAVRPVFRAVT